MQNKAAISSKAARALWNTGSVRCLDGIVDAASSGPLPDTEAGPAQREASAVKPALASWNVHFLASQLGVENVGVAAVFL